MNAPEVIYCLSDSKGTKWWVEIIPKDSPFKVTPYHSSPAVSKMLQEERERCATAVIVNCPNCEGHGYIEAVASRTEHGCGGDENLCARICPIQVQDVEQQRCEYCGRPADTIRSLKSQGEKT